MKKIVERHDEEIKLLRTALLRTQAELLMVVGLLEKLTEKLNVGQDTPA